MSKNYYITTPIYYVNDKPHLGTAYSTIVSDVLNRYHKLFQEETFLLTGVDEHGQKCEQAAKKKSVSPQEHCDEMSEHFEKAWKALDIDYNLFIRTSSKNHKSLVQKLLQELFDKGEIYSNTYKGWYCVSEETFYTEKDLVDGKSPSGKEVTYIEEKNYFFKMSKYQQALNKYLEENPKFIQPSYRQNEIKGFLKKPLQDLCISRPKARLSWGIELPFDKDYVAYVWVDALINYLTGIEHLKDEKTFNKWWNEDGAVHVIGKDILMTHGVYWPCLLMALGLKLPKTIFAHGWLLNESQEKMSKSQGEKLDPLELVEELGVCELRYFLCREIPLGNDAHISRALMIQRINQDLSGQLGNMLSRLTRLVEKNYDSKIVKAKEGTDDSFKEKTSQLCQQVQQKIENYQLHLALEDIMNLLTELNRYLEQKAPWKTVKTNKDETAVVLYNALEVLRICSLLLYPVMPVKIKQMLETLGETVDFKHLKWGRLPLDKDIKHGSAIFPRIQS